MRNRILLVSTTLVAMATCGLLFPPILAIIFDSNLTYSPRKANLFWVQVPSSFALMSAIGKNLLFNYWPTSLSTRGAYIRHSVGFSLA